MIVLLQPTQPPTPSPTPQPTKAPSVPATGAPFVSPTVDPCVVITFDEDANGIPLEAGQYVQNEWIDFGLTLSASGGAGNLPRLFDTANPGTEAKGDPDLGAPNIRCTSPGPGIGEGGEPGEPGENCEEQGFALIVQEPNSFPNVPDDNVDGGKIIFNFSPKADYVFSLGMLDVDYRVKIYVTYMNDAGAILSKTITVPMLGDNSYQVVPIETGLVSKIVVDLERSGAITYIHFCPGGTPPTTIPATKAPPTTIPATKAPPTTIPATQTPPTSGGACTLQTVGFEQDDNGNDLVAGEYVQNQWSKYGMIVSAKGGLGTLPRLFDTANPGEKDVAFGDRDLGSPNETCDPPGPGEGLGGEMGAPGENCVPLGFCLIVQENNERPDIPDDNRGGGIIIFEFTKSGGTFVQDLQLLDIDYRGAEIVIGYLNDNGVERRANIPAESLGNNSIQTVTIEIDNVVWVKVKLLESGAVPSITFCL